MTTVKDALCPHCRQPFKYGSHGNGFCVARIARCGCNRMATMCVGQAVYCRTCAPRDAQVLILDSGKVATP